MAAPTNGSGAEALEALVAESAGNAMNTDAEPPSAKSHPRSRPEAPLGEIGPLVVLAAITTVFGFLGLNHGWFASWLGDADGRAYRTAAAESGKLIQPADAYDLAPALISTVLALLALALGAALVAGAVRAKPGTDPNRVLGRLRRPAREGFHADEVQDAVAVLPVQLAADTVGFLDREVVDGYVRASGTAARGLGEGLRRLQTGNVQLYLTGVLTGVVVIAAVLGFGR
ncbi:MAG: hypothetical protein HOV83_07755 [Catenulispora sp.]|nr:hypothetical protein [Catenulispora sp.]